MKAMFNDKMSSTEAMRMLFEYASAHRGEDMEDVKKEYREVSRKIVLREAKESNGRMTSYPVG